MAGRKSKQSGIGVKDIAAAWRAGWTPSDVNAILDRLESIGDPLDPPDEPADNPADDPTDNPADNPDEPDDDLDDDLDNDPDDLDDESDKLKESIDEGLDLIKHTGLEIENARLKRELQKLQEQNRYKDVSGQTDKTTKSPEQSLIDVFQSCF